jgi:hypothetical protein
MLESLTCRLFATALLGGIVLTVLVAVGAVCAVPEREALSRATALLGTYAGVVVGLRVVCRLLPFGRV